MPLLTALVSGLLFGAGLALSGMVNPAKVLNFLDLAGTFDPTLVFVLGGAVVTTFIGYRLMLPPRPLFAERFQWPTKTDIDGRLVAGAAIFGIGWGLSGFCPGPALGAVVSLRLEPFIFIAAMALGIVGVGWYDRQGADGRVAAKS
ncbi:MAG TPA: DUF6691 family protein [Aestuariivirgaceae bacterium]|nr:DUF6691 family protein [Aestuariivirgaceae bacterium]